MRIFLLILFFLLTSIFALEKNDFAYGKQLFLEKSTGVVKVRLDADIYKSLVHSDFSDLAVFDANGEIMPREISTSSTIQVESEQIEVPFVKFDVLKSDKDQQLHFEYNGALIEMLSSGKTENEDYIIDLRGSARAVKNLFIYSDEKKYMLSVNVECSNNLEEWISLKKSAVIASLDFQNSLLEKNSINLPFVKCRYLRLKTDKKFLISKVEVQEYSANLQAPLEIEKIVYKKNADAYEFEVSKNLNIKELYFELEDKEQLYKLNVFARNSKKEEWKLISKADIYTIVSEDIRLVKHNISLNSRFKYYKIQAQDSSYLPSKASLSYGYNRQDIYFVAQGAEPYILAFGSYESKVSQISLDHLLANKNIILEAKLSDRIELGGTDRLLPKEKETSAITYWVWFALIFGVLILGFMSYILYKQMKEKE